MEPGFFGVFFVVFFGYVFGFRVCFWVWGLGFRS